MRLIFAGTPRFAAVALDALLTAGHDVPLVLTQPDRPAGRGLKRLPSEVKALALQRDLAIEQPPSLRGPDAQARLADVGATLMIVAAYGLLLPQAVLDLFPAGCVNIHASLLPRWRGAAPIQRAILAGDENSGVSIMQMEAGLDTGPVYVDRAIPIGPKETAGGLHDRLAALGAELIVRTLADIGHGNARATPQDDSRATYAAKITRQDSVISWETRAETIDRVIRAFNPVPGASTSVRGEAVKVWAADLTPARSERAPGTVVESGADGILVTCGEGTTLRIRELQRAGGKRLTAREFLQGFPLRTDDRFAAPVTA
ncbi:MAG: methionyl-tRNA formyltransferase [Burkholderiales bacterium]